MASQSGPTPDSQSHESSLAVQRESVVEEEHVAEEERTILVIGKTGHGKSEVANRLLGDAGAFTVGEGLQARTKECSAKTRSVDINGRRYKLKVIDTPGYQHDDERSRFQTLEWCKDQLYQVKIFLKKEAPEGINTVLIVWRTERLTSATRKCLDLMNSKMKIDITCFGIAFTGCDLMPEEERHKTATTFLKDAYAQKTADLIGDRYIAVGFPNVNRMVGAFKVLASAHTANEEVRLRDFVTSEQFRDKKLREELFSKAFWERLPEFLQRLF